MKCNFLLLQLRLRHRSIWVSVVSGGADNYRFVLWMKPRRLCDPVSLWGIRNGWGSRSEIRFPLQRAEDKPCVFLTANTTGTPSFRSFFRSVWTSWHPGRPFPKWGFGFLLVGSDKNYNAINVAKHTWGSRSEPLWPWLEKKNSDP